MNISKFTAFEQAVICVCAVIGFLIGYAFFGESLVEHGPSVFFRMLGLAAGAIAGVLLVKWRRN
jgi:uncharacterized membrane protein required for colicin V production